MKYIFVILITILMAQTVYAETATKPGNYSVVSKGLNVRLAASGEGELTGTLLQNDKVTVFEFQNGWARISDYKSEDGLSGNVARWVFAKFLIPTPPEKTAKLNQTTKEKTPTSKSPFLTAIESSDDFSKYKDRFISTAEALIADKSCTLKEFEEMGGWWRSPNDIPEPVYFLYCGGMDPQNRIFLNAETGTTFR